MTRDDLRTCDGWARAFGMRVFHYFYRGASLCRQWTIRPELAHPSAPMRDEACVTCWGLRFPARKFRRREVSANG